MTTRQIQELIERLPAHQRPEAAKRLLAARDAGWIIAGFWDWQVLPLSQWDLVGFDPKGTFEFIPELKRGTGT